MNKTYITIGIIALLIFIVGVFAINNKKEAPGSLETLPSIFLQDYNENAVNLIDFIGTPLVLNSWAVWCPFCIQELPDFVEMQKEFGEQVIIIAINRAESLKKTKQYTDDLGITDNLLFLLDPDDKFYRNIGGFTMPETIFVDASGNIVEHKRGFMRIEEIREKINNLLSIETIN